MNKGKRVVMVNLKSQSNISESTVYVPTNDEVQQFMEDLHRDDDTHPVIKSPVRAHVHTST